MFLIDFNKISEEHLQGDWYVQSKIVNKSDPASIFAKAKKHQFSLTGYKARNGVEKRGTWTITRESNLLTRPYISFELESERVQGLITKLLYSEDKKNAQLTIYFSTGLELVLLKDEENGI